MPDNPLLSFSDVKTEDSDDSLSYICQKCGGTMARFYSDAEVNQTPAQADKSLIGKTVRASRVVSWVGYKADKDTILLEPDEIDSEAANILVDLSHAKLSHEDALEAIRYEPLRETTRYRKRFIKQIKKEAKYTLRGKRMSNVYRSLWFQDMPAVFEIKETVRCWTGKFSPSYYTHDYYGDEYDPAYLYDEHSHNLYGGYVKDRGDYYLAYPTDIEPTTEKDYWKFVWEGV